MNNLEFFKDHIHSELENSKAYAKKALEIKDISPKIARCLINMSERDLKDAETLQMSMGEYHRDQSMNPNADYKSSDYDTVYSAALEDYSTSAGEIKAMWEMYMNSKTY